MNEHSIEVTSYLLPRHFAHEMQVVGFCLWIFYGAYNGVGKGARPRGIFDVGILIVHKEEVYQITPNPSKVYHDPWPSEENH